MPDRDEEPQPWCHRPKWIPTGGYKACQRARGHQGDCDFGFRPTRQSAECLRCRECDEACEKAPCPECRPRQSIDGGDREQ